MSEDDPLYIASQQLVKAKQEMDAFNLKRKTAKVKPTKLQEQIRQGLQKALLTQKIKFKEEQKKAQALKREVEK